MPTKEFTGELYVRWFQFGAFCPSFRAHGRTWKLRLPWGWDTGTIGVDEIRSYGEAANPGPEELHNAAVEPICRQYLELRYRFLPYLYSVVREAHDTGLPVIRALRLHHADDPAAVARGTSSSGAATSSSPPWWRRGRRSGPSTSRAAPGTTYGPASRSRAAARSVALATTPIYARAGAIIPFGPVKQYTGEAVDAPIELVVYPDTPGRFVLYDDDGITHQYRDGEWAGIILTWDDDARRLSMALTPRSRVRDTTPRRFVARLATRAEGVPIRFEGATVELHFGADPRLK